MGRALGAGVVYYLLAFGAGFILGIGRVLWAVPRFGERAAELIEAPIMFAAVVLLARWVVRRLCVPPAIPLRLTMGAMALTLLLATELTVVLALRGLSIREWLESRDPVSGFVYLFNLGAFMLMPALVHRREPDDGGPE